MFSKRLIDAQRAYNEARRRRRCDRRRQYSGVSQPPPPSDNHHFTSANDGSDFDGDNIELKSNLIQPQAQQQQQQRCRVHSRVAGKKCCSNLILAHKPEEDEEQDPWMEEEQASTTTRSESSSNKSEEDQSPVQRDRDQKGLSAIHSALARATERFPSNMMNHRLQCVLAEAVDGCDAADQRPRTRPTFTNAQLVELEKEYRFNRYLNSGRRLELSIALRLSEQQLKVWFQNRRTKEKHLNSFSKTTTPTAPSGGGVRREQQPPLVVLMDDEPSASSRSSERTLPISSTAINSALFDSSMSPIVINNYTPTDEQAAIIRYQTHFACCYHNNYHAEDYYFPGSSTFSNCPRLSLQQQPTVFRDAPRPRNDYNIMEHRSLTLPITSAAVDHRACCFDPSFYASSLPYLGRIPLDTQLVGSAAEIGGDFVPNL